MKPLKQRKEKYELFKIRNPNQFPIICDSGDHNLPLLDKCKFLVEGSITVLEFTMILKRRLKLVSIQTLILFCGNTLLSANLTIEEVHDSYKDRDSGYLYFIYVAENAFGTSD